MKRISFAIVLVLVAATAFAGGSSEAELGTEENPIIWALVPSGETSEVLAGAEDVVALLEAETGLVFETFVATSYTGVIEAMASDPPGAYMAAMNTFSAILASERGVAEVALIAVRRGSPSYGGQFVVAADAGVESLADLAGQTFARPDPFSTSGWIVPSIVLAAAGVNVDELTVLDAGGHPGVITAVYEGSAVAGSSYVDAREAVADTFSDVNDQVLVLEEYGPIPNDGIQFSPAMPADMRDSIVDAFLTIAATDAGRDALVSVYSWDALIEADDSFYDPFRQVLEASGLDLSQFVD